MIWVSRLGGGLGLVPLCALVTVLLLQQRRPRAALFLVLAYGGAEAIDQLAKFVFHTARPHFWRSPAPASGYSFPSGHAMGSMALFSALVLLAWPTRWRWPVLILGLCAVLLIALSRLYLGVHYPSDVLAGWLAALAWVVGLFFLLTARRWQKTAALYEA
jgi:undecaprenyl-diphosphatase